MTSNFWLDVGLVLGNNLNLCTQDTNRMISLSSSNIPSELIDTMAEETGLLWKCVGRFLGLSEDDLHQYKQLSSGKMRVQQMIRDWCGRSGTNVTVQGLLDVCDHVGVEGEVRSVSQRKHGKHLVNIKHL